MHSTCERRTKPTWRRATTTRRKFHEALTAAIALLEHEHARALERVQEARNKHDQTWKQQQSAPSSAPFSLLPSSMSGSFASWLGSRAEEEEHYMEIASKVASQLDALLHSRNELDLISGLGSSGADSLRESREEDVFLSDTTQRHLLQAPSPHSKPVSEQYYCYPTGFCDVNQLPGFILSESSGYLPLSVGDVNGDGLDDVIIYTVGGLAFIVFGSHNSTAWGTGVRNVYSHMDGLRGFVLRHPTLPLQSGTTADINGDGLADLVLGYDEDLLKGAFYIVFGSSNTSAWSDGILDITSLVDGQRGFVLETEKLVLNDGEYATPQAIYVSAAGDMNADGCDEIVLGALSKTYVVFGSNSSGAWGNGTLNVSSLTTGLGGFVFFNRFARSRAISMEMG